MGLRKRKRTLPPGAMASLCADHSASYPWVLEAVSGQEHPSHHLHLHSSEEESETSER